MTRDASRAGSTCAIAGSVALFLGTYMHPSEADPNDPLAAFAEYAADRLWVASHLAQLAGVTLIAAAILCLARELDAKRGNVWAHLMVGGAIASLAVAAVLQAVDGIALKAMVDTWASAPPGQRDATFYAAFAVRQIEVGLASMLSLAFGATVTVCGIALLQHRVYPAWIGALALAGGVPTIAGGLVMAQQGFSALAMAINMPASCALLLWMIALGILMWRRAGIASVRSAG